MSFLSRLFKAEPHNPPTIVSPDDSHLERRVKKAKWENARAVTEFLEEAQKQEQDALFARQVISDVLERAEKLKAMHDDQHREKK